MSERNRALARGSRIVVYRPGSIFRGFWLFSALLDAISVMLFGSMSVMSFTPVMPAQPEPLPSGIRHVSTRPASAAR